jgi:hypothetical protein
MFQGNVAVLNVSESDWEDNDDPVPDERYAKSFQK